MPIYEYECPKCGRFDVLRKVSQRQLRTHAECGSRVTKLMSAGSFAFKGSGFHVTDYERKGAAPACDKSRGEGCASCPAADPGAA